MEEVAVLSSGVYKLGECDPPKSIKYRVTAEIINQGGQIVAQEPFVALLTYNVWHSEICWLSSFSQI